MCGKRGKQLQLSLSSNLSAFAHFQGVLSTRRDKEMKNYESQRVVLFICIVILNKHTSITDYEVTIKTKHIHTILANSSGCSNCESCIFTVGKKGFAVWFDVCLFTICCCCSFPVFHFDSHQQSMPPPQAVKWRDYKDVCVTAAVWKILLIYLLILASFQFTLLLKLRKNLKWRVEVYFRPFGVTFPVTPFVWYVKVVGCELSQEYVSLLPTTSKTKWGRDHVTWQDDIKRLQKLIHAVSSTHLEEVRGTLPG